MDGLGGVEREDVARGEGREALDEVDEIGSANGSLQNDRHQKLAFGEIRLRGEAEAALSDGRCDVLDTRRGGPHEAVPVLAEERPAAIGEVAKIGGDVGVVAADAALAVGSVQAQTEQAFQPEAAKAEGRDVAVENGVDDELRGGALAEVGLAAGLVEIGVQRGGAEQRAERAAGGGAVVVEPVRVLGETGEVQLAHGADLILLELGDERVEVGGGAQIGVGNARIDDAGMV